MLIRKSGMQEDLSMYGNQYTYAVSGNALYLEYCSDLEHRELLIPAHTP